MAVCASCGEDNLERARFCSICGSPLVPAASPAEVRKTVTMLFCDIARVASAGDRLDPEALRQVMGRFFALVRAVLAGHGATVETYVGDAVMAVFGIPQLHEDDAVRAVRAAAGITNAVAGLNDELERDLGVRITIRMGINTGIVVTGDPVAARTLVTGDAVNVAARIEQLAPPGHTLLSEPTYRLVRHVVVAEPVPPLVAKGKTTPVPARRLVAVRADAPGHGRRLAGGLVGRERETALLQQVFSRAVRDRTCQLLTILGEAGVGKSRLAEEFLAAVGDRAMVLRGRCLSYGEGITFWPLVSVVRQSAGLRGDEPAAAARAKLAALLAGEPHADPIVDRVAELIGAGAPTGTVEETFWAVRRLLETLALARPLVVLFDDIQWAEPLFLDLVEHVADWAVQAPLVLACLGRPELLDARPHWSGGKLNGMCLLLEPLGQAEAERLVAELLGDAELPAGTAARISAAADGNPLFVEELLGMLIDDGLLRRVDGRWVATADLPTVTVPPTIQALLAARLERLPDDERVVAQRGAVVGQSFYRAAVVELAPEPVRRRVGPGLSSLVRKGLIRHSRSDFVDQETFRFRHILLQEAAYESLPKLARADLHEQFASWLDRTSGERVRSYDEIVGYHLEQAHRYRAELGRPRQELAYRAAERLARVGTRAFARGDGPGAVRLLSRALALPSDTHPDRLGLLGQLGEAYRAVGELAAAAAAFDELAARAAERGDRRLVAYAGVERSFVWLLTDPDRRTDRVLREVGEAVPVLEAAGDDHALAEAWQLEAHVHLVRGRMVERIHALERALAHARRCGDGRAEGWIRYCTLGSMAHGPTPVEEVTAFGERHLDWARARGQRLLEAGSLVHLGAMHALRGEVDQGRLLVAQASQVYEELGHEVQLARVSQVTSLIETLAGDLAAAEAELRRGYAALARLGDVSYRSTAAAELAQVLYAQGRVNESEELTFDAERTAAGEDVITQAVWRGVRAKLLAARGEAAPARRLAEQAVALLAASDMVLDQAAALTDLAEVLALTGAHGDAARRLAEAVALYEAKGSVAHIRRARARLAAVPAPRRQDPGAGRR